MEKKTGAIKTYEPVTDSIMSMKEWRRIGKSKKIIYRCVGWFTGGEVVTGLLHCPSA